MTDQLALFDLTEPAPWSTPANLASDPDGPWCDCGALALAKVYGFTAYKPRRAYISTGPNVVACLDCLPAATERVRQDVSGGEGHLIVWSVIWHPIPVPLVSESERAWQEVERVVPPWPLKKEAA